LPHLEIIYPKHSTYRTSPIRTLIMPKNVYSEINLHMTWHTKN